MKEITREKAEKGIYEVFLVSIIAKGGFALLETVLGLMLLFTSSVIDTIQQLIAEELIEDPSDMISHWVEPFLHPTPEAQLFGGLYLLSHGVVKLFLVGGLLLNRLWAYPASIGVFTLFILYQMERYFFKTHSVWLLVLTVADIVVIWLIYHEYRRMLKASEGEPLQIS